MCISVVMLAYREAENLEILFPKVIKELDSIDEDYEIVVVDTAKPLDNTEEVCRRYGVRYT